ncbi:MAG: UbiA family prenyltransferase [Deltaproteobacteria bacterium]|nr:UbiA family prenyltransferase [Deltaproteobacteria bacterium]
MTLSRFKLFLALSRTSHGILDMATPAFAALLWLGQLPPIEIVIIGLITTVAGYTAVYALNDVVDYRQDKIKLQQSNLARTAGDLDAVWVRHPMAQGLLSFKAGLLWAIGWAMVAAIGAYLLNPVCLIIFIAGCALEAVYCLLLKISHHRVIISGGVKTSGAIAAVFAVDPSPDPGYVLMLFLLLFFWEVGGQNVPNDWADMEEDRRLSAKTIPVRFGKDPSIRIILFAIGMTLLLTLCIFSFSKIHFEAPYAPAALIAAIWLIAQPAWLLHRAKDAKAAINLFNKASYFPLAMLIVVLIKILLS